MLIPTPKIPKSNFKVSPQQLLHERSPLSTSSGKVERPYRTLIVVHMGWFRKGCSTSLGSSGRSIPSPHSPPSPPPPHNPSARPGPTRDPPAPGRKPVQHDRSVHPTKPNRRVGRPNRTVRRGQSGSGGSKEPRAPRGNGTDPEATHPRSVRPEVGFPDLDAPRRTVSGASGSESGSSGSWNLAQLQTDQTSLFLSTKNSGAKRV